MKKDTLTAFLAGVAVTAAFFAGLGMARGGLDVQKVVLVDGQGQPVMGPGRFLPIGTPGGSAVEIRSSGFGLQVKGIK
jgi:hypothetical protein